VWRQPIPKSGKLCQ